MGTFYTSARRKFAANRSGQAIVEFAMTVTVLLILLCASIDFGRAFSDMQAMSELTRQGSNLASRGILFAAGGRSGGNGGVRTGP